MVQDMKNNLKKCFSVGPITSFLVVLLIIISSIYIYSVRKTLIVNIDGEETQIITYKKDLESALVRNGIVIGPKDKISKRIDSTVKTGDKIYIKRAVNLEVAVDGNVIKIASAENVIEDMLVAEGLELSEYDKVMPLKTEPVKTDLKIVITRVESQVVKEVNTIDFSTVTKKDDDLEKTVSQVVQEGEFGEREIASRVVFEDGIEVSRQIISDIVNKQPTEKILLQGTLNALNLSRGGGKVLYTTSIPCRATAYYAGIKSTGKEPGMAGYEITSSGARAKRNVNGYSTIAVDPRVIPMGTRVYVEGYGLAIAEDVGGAIKGNKIDVFFNSYDETMSWGVRYVNVYILK